MDLDSFLVALYVLVEDWWKLEHASRPPKTGRPALLSDPEVLTLAILAQWPRFRSERDFWRFAWAHLRSYFPSLCSQSQLPQGMAEGRSALGFWQAPDHRRGHRPAQGLLLFGAPPCQDVGKALLTRLAAKVAAYTCAQRINDSLGRPLRHLADLLV